MPALKMMIVDDSKLTTKKLVAILQGLGHEVVSTCLTGTEAVDTYGAVMPDMVTMDITMPDMDGIEATRRILARFPNALIIMVTSHGQKEMVIDALDAGAKGYVLKPIDKDRLGEMISKVAEKYP